MKVRMIETKVRELDVHVPDSVDSVVDVFQLANQKYEAGEAVEVEGSARSLGQTIISIAADDEKGTILMVQRMGQIVITDAGGPMFRETKESHAKVLAEQEAVAAEAKQTAN